MGQRRTCHIAPNDVDPKTEERRQIHLTFPGRVGGRLDWADGVIDAEDFDRWIYASDTPGGSKVSLALEIGTSNLSASHEYELTEAQKEKLRLAGKGDIKRFLEQVEQRRTEFEESGGYSRRDAPGLRSPLTKIYKKGPFGGGSMFAKTLEKIKRVKALAMTLLSWF